jgi:predicted  nucleic acid-binding Zn-ribbon protein
MKDFSNMLAGGVTPEAVAELLRTRDTAHDEFSAAYHKREDSELALKNASAKLQSLRERITDAKAGLAAATNKALQDAVDAVDVSPIAENLASLRSSCELLQRTRERFEVYPLTDARRARRRA